MNEPTTTETPKPKKKRSKPTAPRAPRAIDPAIEAINEAARKQRAEYRKSGVSARILRVIIDKRLEQMTDTDQEKLMFELKKRVVLPMEESK